MPGLTALQIEHAKLGRHAEQQKADSFDHMLWLPAVLAMTGLSRSTLYQNVGTGTFCEASPIFRGMVPQSHVLQGR